MAYESTFISKKEVLNFIILFQGFFVDFNAFLCFLFQLLSILLARGSIVRRECWQSRELFTAPIGVGNLIAGSSLAHFNLPNKH
jgi:hypothetical protein